MTLPQRVSHEYAIKVTAQKRNVSERATSGNGELRAVELDVRQLGVVEVCESQCVRSTVKTDDNVVEANRDARILLRAEYLN